MGNNPYMGPVPSPDEERNELENLSNEATILRLESEIAALDADLAQARVYMTQALRLKTELDFAKHDVEEVVQERDKAEAENRRLRDLLDDRVHERFAREAEIRRLREALERFIADMGDFADPAALRLAREALRDTTDLRAALMAYDAQYGKRPIGEHNLPTGAVRRIEAVINAARAFIGAR